MLKLSEEQCISAGRMEDDAFVQDTARKLKQRFPVIDEPDETLNARLKVALDYANTVPLKEDNVRRDFLMLEAFFQGFYQKPEVDKWLRTPNGYSPDQRLEDLKHILINREKRKSW
jgi:hypothetical protein